ncbi:MAG: hypothetical protein J5625_10490 [Lachnospiraceae bacterium]|nr:hypothetical protein [Lachnospiraceae bacterium]
MPSLAMYRITPPSDSAEFENICMDYLARKYKGDASLYGRKGQAQQGIDVIVSLEDNSYVCAQCKDLKSLNVKEIDKWIQQVDIECKIPMKEFIILVSVERDAKIQEHICLVTEKRKEEGKIPVKIFFWDDVTHYIKEDLTMLRMYYPEFYGGQNIKITEASNSGEIEYSKRITYEAQLRNLFFDESVKYRVEEFLDSDPVNGVDFELVACADACVWAIKKLLYRAPSLTTENVYFDIEYFIKLLMDYCEFFPNVSESNGVKVFATNKFNTKIEEDDLKHNDELRKKALDKYREIKNY